MRDEPERQERQERHSLLAPERETPPRVAARPRAGMAAALAAMLVMAGYLVLGKYYVGKHIAHGTSSLLVGRQIVASLCMLAIGFVRHGAVMPRRKDLGLFALLGLLNFVNSTLFVWGFTLTNSFITSVAQLLIPVFTFAYTWATGLERASRTQVFGVLFIVVGCAVTATGTATAAHATARAAPRYLALGLVCLLAQTSSFVAMIFRQKPMLDVYPVSLVVAWSYSLGAVGSVLYSLLDGSAFQLGAVFESALALSIVLYSALLGAVAYFELFAFATKHLPATLVSATVALEPAAVSMLGALVFHTRVTPLEVCGYLLAMSGATAIALVVRDAGRRRDRLESPPSAAPAADGGPAAASPREPGTRGVCWACRQP